MNKRFKFKNIFKNLYSTKTKVFILSGLLGGMTACKDVVEPELKTNSQQTTQTHYVVDTDDQSSGDTFLKHLSDIYNTKLYVGSDCYFRPDVGADGNVAGIYGKESSDSYSGESLMWNSDSEEYMERRYNPMDTKAFFKDNEWHFYVGGFFSDPAEDWKIKGVSANDYQNIFANMSDSALAQLAKNHLQSVNADPGHVQNIYQGIIDGHGVWTQGEDSVSMLSFGAKIGLKHSDVGLCEGSQPVMGDSTKHETFPYCGGVEHKRLNAPSAPMKFKGTAYISVMPAEKSVEHSGANGGITGVDLRTFATDSATATLLHGVDADTLIMPFNNWYTIRIITNRQTYQIEMRAENYQSSLPKNVWGLYTETQNNSYTMGASDIMPEIKWLSTENVNQSIAMSLPEYFGEEENITTGLDYVYCAPARKAKASSDETEPSEVVVQGFIDEVRTEGALLKGAEIGFVFGGVKQR